MDDAEGQEATEFEDNHGIDANEKPGGGAKNADNPNDPRVSEDDKEGGSGDKTGALGGAEPSEPGGPGARDTQKHDEGQSGR